MFKYIWFIVSLFIDIDFIIYLFIYDLQKEVKNDEANTKKKKKKSKCQLLWIETALT